MRGGKKKIIMFCDKVYITLFKRIFKKYNTSAVILTVHALFLRKTQKLSENINAATV